MLNSLIALGTKHLLKYSVAASLLLFIISSSLFVVPLSTHTTVLSGSSFTPSSDPAFFFFLNQLVKPFSVLVRQAATPAHSYVGKRTGHYSVVNHIRPNRPKCLTENHVEQQIKFFNFRL